MPTFTPVSDPEAPRWEQDESKLAKHRNFDTHVIARSQTERQALAKGRKDAPDVNRGFEQGAVGWGVLGAFGSDTKDTDAAARAGTARVRDRIARSSGRIAATPRGAVLLVGLSRDSSRVRPIFSGNPRSSARRRAGVLRAGRGQAQDGPEREGPLGPRRERRRRRRAGARARGAS